MANVVMKHGISSELAQWMKRWRKPAPSASAGARAQYSCSARQFL